MWRNLSLYDWVYLVDSGLLTVVMAITIVTFVRIRTVVRADIALTFTLMALGFILTNRPVWAVLPATVTVGILLLFTVPYVALRIVMQFVSLPKRFTGPGMLAVLAICWLAILCWQPRGELAKATGPWYIIVTVALFYVIPQVAITAVFVRQSCLTRGVTRYRLALAALGSVSFISTYVVTYFVQLVASSLVVHLVFLFLLTLSIVSYYLGFATPRWLRSYWQYREFHRFMREAVHQTLSPHVPVSAARQRLLDAAVRSVGAEQAVLAEWDEYGRRFTLWSPDRPNESATVLSDIESLTSLLGERRRAEWGAPSRFGEGVGALARQAGAGSVMAVPVATQDRLYGVLFLFLRCTSLFPDDDMALLAPMAEQLAVLEQLNHVVRDKSFFLRSLMHDLKTPVAILLMQAEALQDGISTDPQRSVAIILRNGRLTHQRLEALFEFARLESPDDPMPLQTQDLVPLIAGVLERLPLQGFRVEWTPPQDLEELLVPVHTAWLERVVENLVMNAQKYAAAGGLVEVTARRSGAQARVEVSDRGAGIAADDLASLFAVGYRREEDRRSRKPGSGYGLAIAWRVIARHGGKLGVYNRPEGGACFWFEIPLVRNR